MIILPSLPLNKPNLKIFSDFLSTLPPTATESLGLVDNHEGRDHHGCSYLELTQLDPNKSVAMPEVWLATCFSDQLPALAEKYEDFIKEASTECSLGGEFYREQTQAQTAIEALFDVVDASMFIDLIAAITVGVVNPYFGKVVRHVSPNRYRKVFPFRGNAAVTINAVMQLVGTSN